jgi:hypothetical protein
MNATPTRRGAAALRVRAEGPIRLDAACVLVPAPTVRGHVSPSTLLRWIIGGELDGARVGGKWHTSADAVGRFLKGRAGG